MSNLSVIEALSELNGVLRGSFVGNDGHYTYMPYGGRLNLASNGGLDLDKECRYPNEHELNPDYYMNAYRRWGTCARVVDIWPDECWAVYPDVYETEESGTTPFEDSWNELLRSTQAFHHLHRADRLSRIGRFGVVFLGLDDGGDPANPPYGIDGKTGISKTDKQRKLLFLRGFDESLVTVEKVVTDLRNPRFGLPETYNFRMAIPNVEEGVLLPIQDTGKLIRVHWTRVLHLADNRLSSEIFGEPAMKPVLNHLIDLRKVAGSSAEMFFKGGFPGFAFETYPDLTGEAAMDEETLAAQIKKYTNGLQRYLATVGGTWKSLQPQVANPNPHMDWYGRLITSTIGVPSRIFFGAESGHLASTQDDFAWRIRLKGRQTKYLDPMVLRPFIDRMIQLNILPPVKEYHTAWQDLRNLSDADRADVALKKVQALMQYVAGGVNQLIPTRELYTMVMGFTEDQADAIENSLKQNPPKDFQLPGGGMDPASGSGGGNRAGNPTQGKRGRPSGKQPKN